MRELRALLILIALLAVLSWRPGTPHAAGSFKVGGHVELDVEIERDLDLDSTANRNLTTAQPELQVEFGYHPTSAFEAYAQFEFQREFPLLEEGREDFRTLTWDLEELYLHLDLSMDAIALRVGRQDFDDYREWLYDEELDGFRLYLTHRDVSAELSAVREEVVGKDLLNPDGRDHINNYIAYGTYGVSDAVDIIAYALIRDDLSEDNESPEFYGLRSAGEAVKGLKHWLELAHVRGEDGDDTIRGYAVDIGGTYTFNLPRKPYLVFGYAWGSGDRDPDDDKDEAFRQTGFEDNTGRFGGVANFAYYGEAFDPELSNMSILTLAAGIRPSPKSSFDIVYHYYRQNEAVDDLAGTDLDVDPEGFSKDLGHEVDLILGYREIDNLRVEVTAGYFMAGDAFADGSDNALFAGFEARYSF